MRTYKFRLYPTKLQEEAFEETIETCRRLYNSMLADRIDNEPGYYAQKQKLVAMKNNDKYLRRVHSQVLQDVVLRVDKAFARFFSGISRFPKFKRRGRYKSFTYPQFVIGFNLDVNNVKLGLIGRVKVKLHRQVRGKPKTGTIIKEIDQWFLALSVEQSPPDQRVSHIPIGSIGIDMGLSSVITLSDGTAIANPKFLKQTGSQIKLLQKEISRKQKGSKSREKARIRLAKAWRKVRRRRDDFAHKVSDDLAKQFSFIVFEDLNVGKMVHNHSLASAIMDSLWGKLRRLTVYKAERRGGRVLFVNPRGTSQKCSGCGSKVTKNLKERTHICPSCGFQVDKDVNAARNILNAGLEQALAETKPLLVQRRRISKFSQRSDKLLALR
ncbi:MAG: transposase [Thaumarchaeota archaeon]|nr:transposase [Nitrososphaerota archaeon]